MTKMMQQVLDRVNALSPEEQERWGKRTARLFTEPLLEL